MSRFANAIRRTATWTNANPEQSGVILAKYSKVDPAVIAGMVRAHFSEDLAPGSMQPLIDVAAKYNGFAAVPATDLIYNPTRKP